MNQDELKTCRKALGWTQVQMARALRIGHRTYKRWETEGNIPDIVAPAVVGIWLMVTIMVEPAMVRSISPEVMAEWEKRMKYGPWGEIRELKA